MADTPSVDPAALVATMLQAIETSLSGATFASEGQFLLAALTVIAFSLLGIRSILAHEPFADTIAGLFTLVLTWGMASYIIGTPSGGSTFGSALIGGFDMLANKLLGGTNFLEALGGMLATAASLFEGDTAVRDSSWWDAVQDVGYLVVTMGMRFFSALFTVVAALLYAGQYLVTQFMIKVGLLMAPILVPWIMVKPTEFLFFGWVKFMILAGLTKVVGALMLKATTGIVTTANQLATQAGGNAEVNFFVYSVVLLVLGIMAYLMLQTTGIAHALVSGGMGMGQFRPPSKLTPGGAANAGSGALGAAGRGAAAGAGGAAGAVAGGVAAGRAAAGAGGGAGAVAGAAMKGGLAALGGAVGGASSSRGGGALGKAASAFRGGEAAGAAKGQKIAEALRSNASGSPTSKAGIQARAARAASAALSTGRTSMSSASGQWRQTSAQAVSFRSPGARSAPSNVSAGYQSAFKAARRSQSK